MRYTDWHSCLVGGVLGSASVSSFTCLVSVLTNKKMKTHVTMSGAMGGMDTQGVDIGETEREFQADLPPFETLDMNMVTRAETILFSTAEEVAKGTRRSAAPRWSAPAELFLICASPSWLSVGARRLEGIGVEEITKTAKKYTRAKQELVSIPVHAQRALHTPCSAHHSNGTLIDKRNGQKGMLGTRVIHVLCPWWKVLSLQRRGKRFLKEGMNTSLQTGTASFADEGEREQCSHNERCMGWHLTSLGKSHLNSLTGNAFSCTKREANEQMFKGDLCMAQRLRNGVFVCRDTMENSRSW